MAQHEREVIGDRTHKTLAEKKAGFVLGKPENLILEAVKKGLGARQQHARDHDNNRRAATVTTSLRATNRSWIARMLNEHGFRTRRVKQFQAVQAQRIIALFA